MNKQEFIEAIEKIGWSVQGKFPNEWIYDNECKNTGIWLLSNRIEIRMPSNSRYAISIL